MALEITSRKATDVPGSPAPIQSNEPSHSSSGGENDARHAKEASMDNPLDRRRRSRPRAPSKPRRPAEYPRSTPYFVNRIRVRPTGLASSNNKIEPRLTSPETRLKPKIVARNSHRPGSHLFRTKSISAIRHIQWCSSAFRALLVREGEPVILRRFRLT